MNRTVAAPLVLALLAAAPGCASRAPRRTAPPPPDSAAPARSGRTPEEIRAGLERAKEGAPHIPMLSEEETREAIPSIPSRSTPPALVRVGARQPGPMEAVLDMFKALRQARALDPRLLGDVFWAVSSENECFY
jgi:hypothetical protein